MATDPNLVSKSTHKQRQHTHFVFGAAVKTCPANEVGKALAAVPVASVIPGPPMEDTWTMGVPATSEGTQSG